MLLSIMDYHQEQFHGTDPEDTNWVGQFGAIVGHYGFHNLGAALWLFPFLIGFLGYRFFFEQKRGLRVRQLVLAFVSVIALSGLLAIFESLELLGFVAEGLEPSIDFGYRWPCWQLDGTSIFRTRLRPSRQHPDFLYGLDQ